MSVVRKPCHKMSVFQKTISHDVCLSENHVTPCPTSRKPRNTMFLSVNHATPCPSSRKPRHMISVFQKTMPHICLPENCRTMSGRRPCHKVYVWQKTVSQGFAIPAVHLCPHHHTSFLIDYKMSERVLAFFVLFFCSRTPTSSLPLSASPSSSL